LLSNETIGIIVDFIGKSRDLLHEFADINKKTIFYLNREVVMSSQSYREPALKDRLLANLLLVLVLSWIVVSAFFMFEIIDPLFWLLIVFTSIILITLWQSVGVQIAALNSRSLFGSIWLPSIQSPLEKKC